MSKDILKRLGEILKDDHNAFTRATAIAAQAEIMRLEERSNGLRRERDALRAELAKRDELLREASELISEAWADAGSDILARIDAALGGGDEKA